MAEVVSFTDPGAAIQKYLNAIDAEDLTNQITDPGDGEAISVANSGTLVLTHTTGNATRTLAAPTFVGQKIDIVLSALTSGDVTVDTASGFDASSTNDLLVFDAAGESARIIGVQEGDALIWRVLRADNAVPTLTN